MCGLWRRQIVFGERGRASALLVQWWVCVDSDNVQFMQYNHGDVRGLRDGEQVFGGCRAAHALCLQRRVLLARGRDDGVYRDHRILHALHRGVFLRRDVISTGGV